MSDFAAITAQLVDIRNLGTEKCVKLTLHVPAEQAGLVLNAFGWPTSIEPVPVAVARLNLATIEKPAAREPARGADSDRLEDDATASRPRKPVSPDKRLAQRIGILCADPVFQQFLFENDMIPEKSEEQATLAVRLICHVQSRSEIKVGTPAGDEWGKLYGKYTGWLYVPEETL